MRVKMTENSTKILNGRWLSKQFERSIASQVEKHVADGKRPPGLGVILVGDNPASLAYVGRKEKVAKRCGFVTKEERLSDTATPKELISVIDSYNNDPEIDGILLQLPLPNHLDSDEMLNRISPKKDADGLHPYNQGLLMCGGGELRPCTPSGLMYLIDLAYSDAQAEGEVDVLKDLPPADLSGKTAVVIGRSILVGKAAAFLLLERNATVTIAHSRTQKIEEVTKGADIVVAAVGRPEMVKGEWIKNGAVVIDVGINRTEEGKLVGDVEFASASEQASAITPVPGGVGPMTVIMLMKNTLKAYENNSTK